MTGFLLCLLDFPLFRLVFLSLMLRPIIGASISDLSVSPSGYIESLPLLNTPEVFGLHPNAEIGYYTQAAKEMWSYMIELQPQSGQYIHVYIIMYHTYDAG